MAGRYDKLFLAVRTGDIARLCGCHRQTVLAKLRGKRFSNPEAFVAWLMRHGGRAWLLEQVLRGELEEESIDESE